MTDCHVQIRRCTMPAETSIHARTTLAILRNRCKRTPKRVLLKADLARYLSSPSSQPPASSILGRCRHMHAYIIQLHLHVARPRTLMPSTEGRFMQLPRCLRKKGFLHFGRVTPPGSSCQFRMVQCNLACILSR